MSTEDLLRGAGLRVTRQRIAVLQVLESNPHVDVAFVTSAVRAELGAVSTQAVYDILAALGDAGLVRKIEPGSAALFELGGDGHQHAICRGCDAVADVPGDSVRILPGVPVVLDFVVDEIDVTLWGKCRTCAESGRKNRSESGREK